MRPPFRSKQQAIIKAPLEDVWALNGKYDYQPIWRMRSKMIALFRLSRSGRRFKGAGKTAASCAACCRLIFRAEVLS